MAVSETHDWSAGDFIRALWLNAITAAALASAFMRHELGGSIEAPIAGTAWVRAYESRPYWLPEDPDEPTLYEGYVHTWFLETKNESGGTSRGRIVRLNADDTVAATVWTSGDSTGTSRDESSHTFEPTVGERYALEFQKDDDAFKAWGWGYVIRLVRELS